MKQDFEFYETPQAFGRYLGAEVTLQGSLFEPCAGTGALLKALPGHDWTTNDLDTRHPAGSHLDAADEACWNGRQIDWTVSNPPFSPAISIITHAIKHSRIGVAMHLRASIHEVLKTGIRRSWMADHTPTGILWLPRFAYQRSKKTGDWTTDSVCACWVVWLKDKSAPQFIRYAPSSVIDALDAETPAYRRRMDAFMARAATSW